jgi:gliding motility-associated-like protein
MYVIHNQCVFDTVYFNGHIYINIKPSPNASLNLSGNTLLCPGDSSLLVATISNFNSPNITYTISPNDSIMATGGYYYVTAYLLDTVSGCSNHISDDKYVTNKPNPFIILNPYNSIICPNDSVKFTLNLTGALNYEWHGPSGLLPITTQSFYSSQAGFYHCIVTDTTGCVFTTNTVELKQYATPYLISTPTNIICNNHPINLHVNTLDSTLIVWNAPLFGGGATKVITNAGVYSCQVTMCGITTSLSIQILGSNPTANITTFGSTTICPFDSVLLTGNPGMTNYIWQPGNHLGQNYTVHSPGTYTLEVTDIYGCTAKSAPVTVAFSSTISPPTSIVNDTICAGQTATLSATSSGTNQIEWFPNSNSGTVINTGNTYITPTLTNQTTYYVTSVSNSGCHSFGVPATVFMFATSAPPLLLSDTTVCKHDSLIITAPYINGATYNWSGPSITSNNTNHILIANADSTNAGLYTLQVTGFGCSSPSTSITIHVLNPLPPIVSSIDSICQYSNYSTAINPSNINYNYEWQGPNNYSSTSDSLNITNANINQSGTYTITSNLFGCLSTPQLLQLTVLEIPPTPTITSNTPCVGDTLFLSTTSHTNYNYSWFNLSGTIGNGNTISMVASDTSFGGYYGVIASNFFCNSAIAYDSITVVPYPTMITTNDTITCNNTSITVVCLSNYQNYNWSNGSSNSSITVSQGGTYWVTTQNGNCAKTDSIRVTMVDCNQITINVFTPNGDGANDIFTFRSLAIKDIHCEITNRWGEKMGEFDGKENGWNGKNMYNNKECEQGTYFYIAQITTIDGTQKNINGFVSLIR